ncbi:MAG: hypothetical protein KDF54_06685 [Hydrogenophaga sp.]|nr:hypothetical protein [Hydrogenophaga sp.]
MDEARTYLTEEPPSEPLFTLDLGANGGMFAPTSAADMLSWIQTELAFWAWIREVSSNGNFKSALDNAMAPLKQAENRAVEAKGYEIPLNESAVVDRAKEVEQLVRVALLELKWPHSSTNLAKATELLRQEDPLAAAAYLYVFVPATQGYPFDARDASSWRGFVQGLMQRYDLAGVGTFELEAQRGALEQLREKYEQVLGKKKNSIELLQGDFARLVGDINTSKNAQETEFSQILTTAKEQHDDSIKEHKEEMEALRRAFNEAMTLRAPVDYWQTKASSHGEKANAWMKWTFGSMVALGLLLGLLAAWVFLTLHDEKPDAWKIAVLVLVGVLGVWAVRLIVRMYLSHQHLATDAEERVTMIKTYLALLEGDRMPSDDDRKLVLTPLFRPATDGIVKDEGLPHPLLELFTRSQGK